VLTSVSRLNLALLVALMTAFFNGISTALLAGLVYPLQIIRIIDDCKSARSGTLRWFQYE
jgi:hypothetical protein